MRHALLVEVGGADDAAICAGLDPVNIAIGADFAAAGLFRHSNDGGESTRFCADFAAKAFTEAALDAGTAAGARLRENSHRRGKRVPTELAGGALKNNSARFHRQRRHGIGFRSWRIKGAGARETRDTNLPFHFCVVRLQVRIGDGPIREICAWNRPYFTAFYEVNFVEAPVIRGEMDA